MSYQADVVEVGGNGGNAFEFNGIKNVNMLKRIQVWEGDMQINSMNVWLTDGQFKQFGAPSGNMKEFTFKDGEDFTSLSLWPSQDGARLGSIKFKTSHSREFCAKVTSSGLKPEVPVDVASGICMGVKGGSSSYIDRLGFIFLNNVKSAQLTNVLYPNIQNVIPTVDVEEIKSMSYQNNTSVTQKYKIEKSKKITQTSSWSVLGKLEFFFSLEVNAGIPRLVAVSTGYELKVGGDGTYASDYTEVEMKLFSFSLKVPAGNIMDAHIENGKATVDLPFTGNMKITCYNDSVLEFNTSGTYKGVAYSDGKLAVN